MQSSQSGSALEHEALVRGNASYTRNAKSARTARLLGLVLGCSIPCLGGTAFAQAEPDAAASADVGRAVRLLVLGGVPEFVARVRGQLSDLDVSIETDPSLARGSPAELDAALSGLATRHDADVIAWLGEARDDANASSAGAGASGTTDRVHIWVATRRQVYSRRIGPPRPSTPSPPEPAGESHVSALDTRRRAAIGSEQSATLETAALVVRSAVRSVLFEQRVAGGSADDAAATLDPPAPIAAPKRVLTTASTAPPEAAGTAAPRASSAASLEDREGSADASPRSGSASLGWAAHAGLDWTYAGLSPSGSWSLDAGLALRLQRFRLGVGGSYGFPEIVRHADVQLELQRQTAFVEVGWEALSLPRFVLLPTLQVGAARFTRSSSTSAPDRLAAPAEWSLSALACLALVAQYDLSGVLRLSWGVGVDYLSHVPRYLLARPGEQQIPLLEAWRWQPNAGIALGAVF
jgi:hypothetical protein